MVLNFFNRVFGSGCVISYIAIVNQYIDTNLIYSNIRQ